MRVETKKANKDYPEFGIKKGDTYYQWAFFRQRPTKSKTYPTRAQLTQNDTLQMVYAAYDGDAPTDADDVEAMAGSVREAAESAREKYDNLPENFQQSEAGQRLEEWADACDSAADELDQITGDLREEEDREMPEKPELGQGEADEVYEGRLKKLLEEAGIDNSATYYELDVNAWTWELNIETLQEAINGTEPDLG